MSDTYAALSCAGAGYCPEADPIRCFFDPCPLNLSAMQRCHLTYKCDFGPAMKVIERINFAHNIGCTSLEECVRDLIKEAP